MTSAPQLVVFDLDFTLWDCGGTWCDCLSPPFSAPGGKVIDRNGRHIRLYEDVLAILDECERIGSQLALASRTEQPTWARELIKLLEVRDRFQFAEIYPSSKLRHFAALCEASGLSYDEMLFFDDETRNIVEVSGLGVTSIHVTDGMTLPLFRHGLAEWREQISDG